MISHLARTNHNHEAVVLKGKTLWTLILWGYCASNCWGTYIKHPRVGSSWEGGTAIFHLHPVQYLHQYTKIQALYWAYQKIGKWRLLVLFMEHWVWKAKREKYNKRERRLSTNCFFLATTLKAIHRERTMWTKIWCNLTRTILSSY